MVIFKAISAVFYKKLLFVLILFFTTSTLYAAVIPQSGWSLLYVDSEQLPEFPATNAFDGDPSTKWHTAMGSSNPGHPHEIQIDLGAIYDIDGFRYLPRQWPESKDGTIYRYSFYVSGDGVNWLKVLDGSFKPKNRTEKEVLFSTQTARYIRLVAKKEIQGNPWTSMAELNVLGTIVSGNQAPNGVIDSPTGNVSINAGETVNFAGTGSDPDGDPSLIYLWDFDGGAPNSTAEDPGSIQFNNPGTYNVTFTVTDSSNVSDPTPGQRTITVTNNGGCGSLFVEITKPLTKAIQAPPNFTVTTNACLDSQNHSGVKFKLDGGNSQGGAEITDLSSPYAAVFSNVPMTDGHTIEAVIIDNNGNEVSGQNTSDTVTQIGSGDYYVAIGDSITFGVGDNISSDDTSQDGRNQSQGYTPILNDLLTQSKSYPHTVVNKGVSGHKSIEGLSLLPSIIAEHPDARFYLIQYGTNDATGGGVIPVPSGLGLNSGDPGYPGTYKHNMQQIIDLIRNSSGVSKEPYLAKLPYAPTAPNLSQRMAEYNLVIDELVSANSIAVTPPDFYAYFQANPNQFHDNVHPNGAGYQGMAGLWANSLSSFNQAPNGVINSPTSSVSINVGQSVSFTGTGSDPDGDTSLTYFWYFGGGAPNSTAEDPGPVQFNNPGTYNVTFTVTDSLGLADPTPAQRTIVVGGGSSGGVIPQSGWSLLYVDSEQLPEFPATNAFDGDPSTKWHTAMGSSNPGHPHEIQIDLGAIYDIDGFRYLPRQWPESKDGTIYRYSFYVSGDGVNWLKVLDGSFKPKNRTEKEVLFSTQTARYIRLVAKKEIQGNPWTSMAELNVLGVFSSGP